MKKAYRVLAGLIALGVVVQAAAIAYGWFAVLVDLEDGATLTNDYDGNAGHMLHGINGMMVMPILALLLFISSFFAKIRGGTKWAGFVLLAVVVQVVLAFISFGVAAVGALHGINALVILGLAVMTARRAATSDAEHVAAPTSAQHGGVPQQSSSV